MKYDPSTGVVCIFCQNTKFPGDFLNDKKFDTTWKLEFLKCHLTGKMHVYAALKPRQPNHLLPPTIVPAMLQQNSDKERKQAKPDQIKGLIDSILLVIKINYPLLSVQYINEFKKKHVKLPDSWGSKNYAFEFLVTINLVVENDMFKQIFSANFLTLAINESPNIIVNKCFVLYIKHRPKDCNEYKAYLAE